jgi:hypothetical protein
MDCLDRECLLAYLEGEAAFAECDHIEGCLACQTVVAELMPLTQDALSPEERRAAGEPAYAPEELERAVAVVAALGGSPRTPGGPGEAAPDEGPALLPSTALVGEAFPVNTPLQRGQATGPVSLRFLEPPQGPGELGRLGKYRLLEVLGQGGMGVVLRAEDMRLARQVALKVMQPRLAADPGARERFLREARAMAAVEHEHVAAIHEVDELRGTPFLAMPLLKGESLEKRLQRGPSLSLAEAVRIVREAAEGLAAAHAEGLIHRDVKPSNLWLEGEQAKVKVLDFGLALPLEGDAALTGSGAVLGTPAYMAPEQAAGEAVDGRADLFSLGVVLYQLCTGVRPFQAPNRLAVLRRLAVHEPSPPAELDRATPAALSDLVMRLLSKDRDGRPATAEKTVELLGEIERALAASAAATTSFPGRKAAGPGPRRRRRALAAGGVALAACLIGGVALAVWLRPRGPGPSNPEAAPLKGAIDVAVWEKGNPLRQRLRLHQPRALPLKAGDLLQINVTLNRPAYVYVVWLDAHGKATPIYPWRDEDWNDRPEAEEKRDRLTLPEGPDVDVAPLPPGASGVESLLLLARDEPLPRSENLAGLFAGLPEQTGLPADARAAAWFENGELLRNEADRSPIQIGKARPSDDPVLRTQALLRGKLKPLFPYSRAVCFGFKGN